MKDGQDRSVTMTPGEAARLIAELPPYAAPLARALRMASELVRQGSASSAAVEVWVKP